MAGRVPGSTRPRRKPPVGGAASASAPRRLRDANAAPLLPYRAAGTTATRIRRKRFCRERVCRREHHALTC
eukprot:6086453-Pyramimonas_sp.AAC.1